MGNDTKTVGGGFQPSMKADATGLRDAFLRSFSQNAVIGKLFGENGAVIFEGKSPAAWLKEFAVLDSSKKNYVLTSEELRSLWLKLAEKYHRAASFHANQTLAARALESLIEEQESQYIRDEVAKYAPKGEYWNDEAGKPNLRRPGKAVLEDIAKARASDARKTLRRIKMEAEFFHHIMMKLETERRCLKDYGELYQIDPATRGF